MDAIIHRAHEGRTGKRTASTEIPESVKATRKNKETIKDFRAVCGTGEARECWFHA